MTIPTLGNLAWHDSWASFGESPYTFLAKLRALNCANKRYFFNQFGTTKDYSFVSIPCMREAPIAQRAVAASVLAQLGSIFSQCGGDERLRFCPTCLRSGYHAALFQLDGVELCPIHEEPIIDRCIKCQRPTPRFALDYRGSFPAFSCPHCRAMLAGGENLDLRPSEWVGQDNVTPVQAFHTWATTGATRISLRTSDSWLTCAPAPQAARRAALLKVLCELDSADQKIFRQVDIEYSAPILTRDEKRTPTYRHTIASTLPEHVQDQDLCWEGWGILHLGLQIPVDLEVSVEQHAAYIWRCQFQNCYSIGQPELPDRGNVKFTNALKRLSALALPSGMTFTGHRACEELARTMWRASLRVALAWRSHLEASFAKRIKPPVDEAWLQRVGRWDWRKASPIGVAHLHAPPGAGAVRLFIS